MKCFAFSKILLRYLRFLFHFEFPYFFNTYYIFWQNSILFQGLGNQFWNSILLIPRGSPVCCTWYYISRQVRRTIGSTLQRESKCDCSENYICLKKPNQLKAEAEHRRPATNSPPPEVVTALVRATVSSSKSCSTSPFLFREETAELRYGWSWRHGRNPSGARRANVRRLGFYREVARFFAIARQPQKTPGARKRAFNPETYLKHITEEYLVWTRFSPPLKAFFAQNRICKKLQLMVDFFFHWVPPASVTFACHLPDFAQKQ